MRRPEKFSSPEIENCSAILRTFYPLNIPAYFVDEPPLVAQFDRIVFASGSNPPTTVQLRLDRGGNLFSGDLVEHDAIEEDTKLPILIAGQNACGKTSLLKGLEEITDILGSPHITSKESEATFSRLKKMGIARLDVQFAIPLKMWFDGGAPFSQPHYEFEQLIEITMSMEQTMLQWRDGLRLREYGKPSSTAITKYHHSSAELHEDKGRGRFRGRKNPESMLRFLSEHLQQPTLEFDDHSDDIAFQTARMIAVDRSTSNQEVKKIKRVLPSLNNALKTWREEPEELRRLLFDRVNGNRLFTEIGLTTNNVMRFNPMSQSWELLDYAPLIIEDLMKGPKEHTTYSWFNDCAFSTKQDALDYIMEGFIHDLVFYVTGAVNSHRKVEGRISDTNERGVFYGTRWVDDETFPETHHGKNFPYSDPHHRWAKSDWSNPSLTEILAKVPFLSGLLGLKQDDAPLLDILARFNVFTDIEAIEGEYLTSGQQQLLSLISAVRRAPEGSLILIDEPEISLHMNWQEKLVEHLHAPLVSSRLLIATHSPDIVLRHRHLCTTIETAEEGGFRHASS